MIESGFRSFDLKWAFNLDDCNNWILKTFFDKREVFVLHSSNGRR